MRILLVDDDSIMRRGIAVFLKTRKHVVQEACSGLEALPHLVQGRYDLMISDVKMPGMGGLELLEELKKTGNDIPVIMMTAYATVEDAVKAVRMGADDYMTKPLNLDELSLKMDKLQQKRELIAENKRLKQLLAGVDYHEIVGSSRPLEQLKHSINQLESDPNVPVMIYGESGTGKELVAKMIQRRSQRINKPFIITNCAAYSEELLESELFGHKKGAFTGAARNKIGVFQAADSGTLFLDEVSEMSARMQTKLLRVIQEQEVTPVGSTETIHFDVRIIGASNRNLQEEVQKGRFREDLYYRLNVVEINVPPLRDRTSDIPILLEHFTNKHKGPDPGRSVLFSDASITVLQNYSWPGNIRELENLLRRLMVTCQQKTVQPSDLPPHISENQNLSASYSSLLDQTDFKKAVQTLTRSFEIEFLRHHLKRHEGNVTKTANAIGLSRVSLHAKLKQYQLDPTNL